MVENITGREKLKGTDPPATDANRHTLTISTEIACSLVIIIGCATNRGASFVISHVYLLLLFILAPLILGQYLDYIDKLRVKSFVLLSIDMLLLLCTFRCTV